MNYLNRVKELEYIKKYMNLNEDQLDFVNKNLKICAEGMLKYICKSQNICPVCCKGLNPDGVIRVSYDLGVIEPDVYANVCKNPDCAYNKQLVCEVKKYTSYRHNSNDIPMKNSFDGWNVIVNRR